MDDHPGIPDDMKTWLTRTTLRDPEGWFVDALTGGRTSASGEVVNPSTALGLSAYFAAIRAISEDVGKVPLPVFKRGKGQDKERQTKHTTHILLNRSPNPDMSAMDWRQTITSHALSYGNGYSEIVRNKAGIAMRLWPLSPTSVKPERIDNDGTLVYRVTRNPGEKQVVLDQSQVFHLRGLGFDGILGYSIATLAKQSIGLGLATEKSGAAFFGNSSRPDGLLLAPEGKTIGKKGKENLKEAWEEAYGGAGNAHKTAVLEGGMKWQSISIPNEDAQWIETRQFNVSDIARWFRVPPHKLQDLLRGTFSNIEHQSIEYVTDTLSSWFKRWEGEIQRKLIPESEQSTTFAEHIAEGLLRGDINTRYTAYATARMNGWLSVNEIRALENMNSIGPEGDVYMAPLNMVPAEQFGEEPEPVVPALPPPPDNTNENGNENSNETISASLPQKLAETNLPLLTAAYERALRIEIDKVQRAAKNGGPQKLIGTFYAGELKNLQDSLDEAVSAYCGSVWAAMKGTPLTGEVHSVIRLRIVDMVNRHTDRSTTDITAAVELGDYEPMLEVWRGDRALTVARTEIADLAYFMAGMCGKREGGA